jgi:SpoVK/Ycf46/Vps4 family AAA+-type ATPase
VSDNPIERYLRPHTAAEGVDLTAVAQRTAGYSGSDVMLLCKECAMRPLRRGCTS